jgi:putative FmdB family regulatory protein
MPTYEYRCKDCGHTFDAYQSFTEDALTECPECNGLVKKVFGNVGIAFKGSGFYKTDSRSGSSSSSSSSNGGSEKKDAASTSTSSTSTSSSSDGGSSSSGSGSSSGKKESSAGSSGS